MSQTLCILGRQPELGLAELESLHGDKALTLVDGGNAMLNVDPVDVNFQRLGGVMKAGKLLYEFNSSDWRKIQDYLVKTIPKHLEFVPEGKLTIGLSAYGLDVSPKKIEATALELKKVIKISGKSVRIVPNKTKELSSAQVLHNKLYTPSGWELFFVKHGDKVLMAQTVYIQDIEAYTARDQARPKRDAKVGMLPPKLAQIIINLADPPMNGTVLDPFCGTGVILQEALLMKYHAVGSDLDPRMVMYAAENLEWLATRFPVSDIESNVTIGDATIFNWRFPFDTIAAETYLGKAFSSKPAPDVLRQVMSDVNTIHKKFLKNVAAQTEKGFRLALAVPAWKVGSEFKRLPSLDHLEELGYTRLSFVHAGDQPLIYHREGQIVGRELVTLIRK
jgi:tRNA G10  N-methylase Trm11